MAADSTHSRQVQQVRAAVAATPKEGEYPGSDARLVSDLYTRYRKELRRYFVRRGRLEDADDLVQVMFLDLVSRPPPQDLRNAQAYLFGAAWTTLCDLSRQADRSPPTVSISGTPTGDTEMSSGLWQEDDSSSLVLQAQLSRVLAKLPAACQVAILRQRRDGWTYQQIAEALGVTMHAVKKYITKSLRHLSEHFGSADPVRGVKK